MDYQESMDSLNVYCRQSKDKRLEFSNLFSQMSKTYGISIDTLIADISKDDELFKLTAIVEKLNRMSKSGKRELQFDKSRYNLKDSNYHRLNTLICDNVEGERELYASPCPTSESDYGIAIKSIIRQLTKKIEYLKKNKYLLRQYINTSRIVAKAQDYYRFSIGYHAEQQDFDRTPFYTANDEYDKTSHYQIVNTLAYNELHRNEIILPSRNKRGINTLIVDYLQKEEKSELKAIVDKLNQEAELLKKTYKQYGICRNVAKKIKKIQQDIAEEGIIARLKIANDTLKIVVKESEFPHEKPIKKPSLAKQTKLNIFTSFVDGCIPVEDAKQQGELKYVNV